MLFFCALNPDNSNKETYRRIAWKKKLFWTYCNSVWINGKMYYAYLKKNTISCKLYYDIKIYMWHYYRVFFTLSRPHPVTIVLYNLIPCYVRHSFRFYEFSRQHLLCLVDSRGLKIIIFFIDNYRSAGCISFFFYFELLLEIRWSQDCLRFYWYSRVFKAFLELPMG